MTKRLTPMLDDPGESAQVRQLLDAGRNARVTDYDFDQGLRRHLSQIDAGVALPHWAESLQAGASAAGGGAASGSLWLWIGLPLISVATISAVVLIRSGEAPAMPAALPAGSVAPTTQVAPQPAPQAAPVAEESAPRTPARHRVEVAQPNRPRRTRPATSAPSERAAAAEPTQVARRAEKSSMPAPGPALPLRAESAVKTERSAAPGAVAAPAATKVAPARQQPVAEPEAEAEETAARAPERPEPKPVIDEARLEREMGMLAMTQRVLFTDPARALNLARQGEAEFEGSMFTQERQQLLLLALVKLGRLDEAKRLARPYLARYPHGPFSDRVRRSLATGRVDR